MSTYLKSIRNAGDFDAAMLELEKWWKKDGEATDIINAALTRVSELDVEIEEHKKKLEEREQQLARVQKLFQQANERQITTDPYITLSEDPFVGWTDLRTSYNDAVKATHSTYRKIVGRLHWKRSFEI